MDYSLKSHYKNFLEGILKENYNTKYNSYYYDEFI